MMRLRVDETEKTTHTDCADGLPTSRRTAKNQDAKPMCGGNACGKTLNVGC